MRRIAILGNADSTKDLAPFDDPTWEIWGLAWRALHHPRMDVCFEVHSLPVIIEEFGQDALEWYADPFTKAGEPIVYMMPAVAAEFPKVRAYPVADAAALMGGREYFTSSFSYMLALALLQDDVSEIGVWGVDLTDGEEYTEQRPCAEFLLGIAHARGIKLTIPPQSALLRHKWRYGLDDAPTDDPLYKQYVRKAANYRAKVRELLTDLPQQIAALEGAAHECDEFAKDILDQGRKGAAQ